MDDDPIKAAEQATQACRDTARLLRAGVLDHGDLYNLSGELVATLRALHDLAWVLADQVGRYDGPDRRLRDDEGADPAVRLALASTDLLQAAGWLARAERDANRAWSAIGHVGLEYPATSSDEREGDGR